MDYLKRVITQIQDFLAALTPTKKLALMGTLAAVVAGFVVLFTWAGDQTYKSLMSNLNPEDSANIIRILREKQIPFRVEEGGRKIEVPPESIDQLRLELATIGLPESGSVGYEIFDTQSLGTTSFVQRVNQQRALEGELMRTITAIKGVKRSRVHLAIPKKRAFIEDQKKPTASVIVDLEPGVRLSEKQIYGVGNLVASAVEGLEVSDVVVVSATGKVLSKNTRDPLVALTASQLDYQRKVEEDLEKRVTSMLNPIVGEGKVVATVSVELDFSQVSETEQIVDGDSAAVRSQQKDVENMNQSRPGPVGVAGAVSNQPGLEPNGNREVKTDTSKSREVNNFTIPQTVRTTRRPVGTIKKLSVAVVVDGQEVKSEGENGEVLSKVEPWSKDRLEEFRNIVARSVGLNEKRGDLVEISNLNFNRTDFSEAESLLKANEQRAYYMNMVTYGVVGLIIVLFFLFVVRPFIKWMTENTIDSVDTFLPQTIEELEKIQKNQALPGLEEAMPELPEQIDPEKVEGEMIKEKIITLVDGNPHKAALILRDWIRGEDKKKESGDSQSA